MVDLTPFPDKLPTEDQSAHSITHESKEATAARPLNQQQQQQQKEHRCRQEGTEKIVT